MSAITGCNCKICKVSRRFNILGEFCFVDVQKKFRDEALKCHPDKVGGSTERFQKLNAALMFVKEIHEKGINILPLCETLSLPLKAAGGGGGGSRFRSSDDINDLYDPELHEEFNRTVRRNMKEHQDLEWARKIQIVEFIQKYENPTKLVGHDDLWIMRGIKGDHGIWIRFMSSSPTKKEIKKFLEENFNTGRRFESRR